MKTAKRFAMLAGLALALMVVPSFAGCSKKGGTAKAAPESDFEFRLSKDGTFIGITKYKGNAKNLVIPETIQGLPVEVIGGFILNKKIKSVVIPSSVKVIQELAFSSCESLENVTLPEELFYIGKKAFSDCVSLKMVTLPEKLFAIEEDAFSNTGLTSVTLPKGLEYLDRAFRECNNLAEINIPDDAAFLLKNATECVEALKEYYKSKQWTSSFTNTGDEIFSGSIIDESVALQKKLREIKCISYYCARNYYSKAKEKHKKYLSLILSFY